MRHIFCTSFVVKEGSFTRKATHRLLINISFFGAFMVILPHCILGQVSEYHFSHRPHGNRLSGEKTLLKPYDIFDRTRQGAIVINNSMEEDTTFVTGPGFPIGFNFYYDGQYFDRFAASANGYIKLGHSSETFTIKRDTLLGATFEDGFGQARKNTIAIFQTDVNTHIPFGNALNYATAIGFPGDRQTMVSWLFSYSPGFYPEYKGKSRYVKAIIRLNERDGSIYMTYSANGRSPLPTHINQVAVGLRGDQPNNQPENLHWRTVKAGENTWESSVKGDAPGQYMDFSRDLLAVNRSGDPNSRTFTFRPPTDPLEQPESPVVYILVPNYYPGAAYGDKDNYFVLADGAINVSLSPRMGWSDASLLPNTYDIYLGTDNPPVEKIASDISENRLKLPDLAPNITYYMAIDAKNANGAATRRIIHFTTGSQQEYCNPLATSGGWIAIKSVSFNTLQYNRNEEVQDVVEFPAESPYTTTLERGNTYTIRYELESKYGNNDGVYVFIDFNQDGLLSETNDANNPEGFVIGTVQPGRTLEGSITIPHDALLGNTRMRILGVPTRNFGNRWNPCLGGRRRQDYTITIAPSTSCSGFSMEPEVNNIDCHHGESGMIDLNLSGGKLPISVRWEKDGEDYPGTSPVLEQLARGTYQAFVQDAQGCTMQTQRIAVTQPAALELSEVAVNSLACIDSHDGVATVTVRGGKLPYTFKWSDGQTSNIAKNLSAEEYSVNITDDNGCELIVESIKPEAPQPLNAKLILTPLSCVDSNDGTASVDVQGGKPPYAFDWSDGQTSNIAKNLSAEEYSVNITDDNGCELTVESIKPAAPEPLNAALKITPLSCNISRDGIASVTVQGGQPPYAFKWSDGQTSETAKNLDARKYSVNIIDGNGCELTVESIIPEAPQPLTAKIVEEDPVEGHPLTVEARGGTPPYNFSWDNGHTGPVLKNAKAGQYTINITDSQGCTFTLSEITVDAVTGLGNPVLAGLEIFPNPSNGLVNIRLLESGVIKQNRWWIVLSNSLGQVVWRSNYFTGGQAQINVENLPSGQYSLSVTDGSTTYIHRLAVP